MAETPAFVFKMLSPVVPILHELAELLYQWEKPYQFNHDNFERAFGANVMPHREAVPQTVNWFRAKNVSAPQ